MAAAFAVVPPSRPNSYHTHLIFTMNGAILLHAGFCDSEDFDKTPSGSHVHVRQPLYPKFISNYKYSEAFAPEVLERIIS